MDGDRGKDYSVMVEEEQQQDLASRKAGYVVYITPDNYAQSYPPAITTYAFTWSNHSSTVTCGLRSCYGW